MNTAHIYNPKTKSIRAYIESSIHLWDLSLENFDGSKIHYFKELETIALINQELSNTENSIQTSKQNYIAWVEKIIHAIKEKKFLKVVAAQKQVYISDNSSIDYEILLHKLIEAFSETFAYLIYLDGYIWLGASPEIIGILEENKFSTISLAGTTIHRQESFGEKERIEQNIVSDVIGKQLSTLGSTLNFSETKLLSYGAIAHLVNEYSLDIDEKFNFSNTIHEIHPSPALAGYPKLDSIQYILDNEPLNREYYCGLIHIKHKENTQYSFAVIRCAKFSRNQIDFYAGAGITEDSIPEKEWEETMQKIKVLKESILDSETMKDKLN